MKRIGDVGLIHSLETIVPLVFCPFRWLSSFEVAFSDVVAGAQKHAVLSGSVVA